MGNDNVTVLAAGEAGSSNFLVPDGTFFVVLVIFLIVLGVIATFVVPPIMKVLRERANMVNTTIEDDKNSADVLAAARADFKAAIGKARANASGIRGETREEGRRLLEAMRARASAEATQALQQASEQLKLQADAFATNLRASVKRMSETLARRILGVDRASSGRSAATGGRGGADKTAASTTSGR